MKNGGVQELYSLVLPLGSLTMHITKISKSFLLLEKLVIWMRSEIRFFGGDLVPRRLVKTKPSPKTESENSERKNWIIVAGYVAFCVKQMWLVSF